MLQPPEFPQGAPATPSEVESERLKHLNDVESKDQEALRCPEQQVQEPLRCPDQQDREALLQVIVSELGFDNGRPVVACVTYKALLHWRSFEAERTSVFDRIIQTIGGAIENQQSNERLAYWFANTSCLLFLLQRTLKASGRAGSQAQTIRFDRMSQHISSFHAPCACAASPPLRPPFPSPHITRTPAVYCCGVSAALSATESTLLLRRECCSFSNGEYVKAGLGELDHWLVMLADHLFYLPSYTPLRNHLCSLLLRREWCSFSNGEHVKAGLGELDHWLVMLADHLLFYLPSYTPLRNHLCSLLLRRECCSFSNGEYVKAVNTISHSYIHIFLSSSPPLPLSCSSLLPLSPSTVPPPHLPSPPISSSVALPGDSPEAHKETAALFLPFHPPNPPLLHFALCVELQVIRQKPTKSMQEITSDLCPALSIQQLYRISTMYWDDKYGTHTVSSAVISEMRRRMSNENSASVTNSFLLDDDSSIPFSVEDISKSTHEIDLRSLQLPPAIRDNSTFQFLLTH
ncbi:unnamed protein product [Closterium sp. Naga37s-1]|nr:unnamed protein product [Closterium sp. Naga37s-1]